MTLKFLIKLLGVKPCTSLKCFRSQNVMMFLYASMEVAASVPNIICIALITCEFLYYTLLVDQGRLFFCGSQVISDLSACVNTSCSYCLIFVPRSSSCLANHLSRFLIFNPLTPMPTLTGHDEPWPFFHF